MRIAVTGATGFVGRALVTALIERDDEVVAISRNPQRAQSQLPLIAAHQSYDELREALKGTDVVVHLAGETVTGRWTDEKKRAIRDSRVQGTRDLVDVIAQPSDVEAYEHERLGIICQTTMPLQTVQTIKSRIESMNPTVDIRFVDTVCHPTHGILKHIACRAAIPKMLIAMTVHRIERDQ